MTENLTAVATKIDWSSLSGVILDGGYELKEVLETRDNAARVRVRILGSGGKTATAYFMHLEPADAEDQLDIWTTLREAPHPNLNRPAALGKREVSGLQTVYMLLPDADEKLAAVVPERPLEWEEAAEVLQSCEKALAHLHAHGLLHGSVSPQSVEAVGYSVQLNTESVYRIGKTPRVQWQKPQYLAPESKNLNLTTAADVWCLGATLFEVLSQEPYGTAGAELEKGLPLAAVVQRCLDKNPLTRCTLKDASTLQASSAHAAQTAPPASPAEPPVVEAKKQSPPVRPVAETRVPPPRPNPPTPPQGTAAARGASRLPQPLTPKEPPKQVTKEDMALVPIGKRHKKVQRQPVGARIRTLDGPQEDPIVGEAESTAIGPAVSARITALGHKSNLLRNVVAGVGLAGMLAAAIWLIVIPKLKSVDQPLTSTITIQTPTEEAHTDSAPNVPLLPQSPLASPANEAGNIAPVPSTPLPAATEQPSAPVAPKIHKYFRVVVAESATRNEAVAVRDTLASQHPELILQIAKMKTSNSGNEMHYVVSVGGILESSDAEPLVGRMQAKGLKTARLERVEK